MTFMQKMDMIPRHQCVDERKRKTDVKRYNSDLKRKRETDVKNSDLTREKSAILT